MESGRRLSDSNIRKSSNGRRAVSKTVNVGSIPAFRAKLGTVTPSPTQVEVSPSVTRLELKQE